jgi:hypothetical protein
MDDQNREGHLGVESFYNLEKIKLTKPFWRRHLWQIIALGSLGLVVLFASTTFMLWQKSRLISLEDGTWQGQFTYYPGEPSFSPFQATLQISLHQGDIFTGTLSEPVYGNSIVNVSGVSGESNQFDQSQLQYVTHLYGNGTGTFITFTDPTYVQGDQIQLDCSYIAVVYPDGSLHGVWFYPNRTQPDGTFILNKRAS